MPDNPHEYSLKSEWENPILFSRAVRAIRENGVDETWEGDKFRYLEIGGYHYWTMGAPVWQTILINRKQVPVNGKKENDV